MITKAVIDSFSDALLADQRVITPQEKELLADLLRHATRPSPISTENLSDAIARIAGEILTQRACSMVGLGLIEHLAEQPSIYRELQRINSFAPQPPGPSPPAPPGPRQHTAMAPQPPSPSPPAPPGPRQHLTLAPQPPSPSPPAPPGPRQYMAMAPQPPSPSPPAPPGPRAYPSARWQATATALAYAEEPEALPAHCVVLEELLAPSEMEELLHHSLLHEMDFRSSEVVAPGYSGGATDFEHRRSRVLLELGKVGQIVEERLKSCLPRFLPELGISPFPVAHVETQITASNHGDFFHWHSDNGQENVASRQVTFVYFFHREPKQFSGGELRIYDSRRENGIMQPMENYRVIVPQQNQAVLFVSSLAHEITPVICPTGSFADSRFTVNGWFHR